MLTTPASFHVNDSVVRKTSRRKIVGTVVSVHGAKVYVEWHKSQGGFTRIAGGNQSSLIKADCLILAKDFIPRPLSSPPLNAPRTSAWHVSLEWHPSGRRVGEYGVNLWWEESEEAGRVRFVEVCLAHPGCEVKFSRQDTITWIPQGCRCERERTEWVRLETQEANVVGIGQMSAKTRTCALCFKPMGKERGLEHLSCARRENLLSAHE